MAANMSVRGTAVDNIKPIIETAVTSGSVAGGVASYYQIIDGLPAVAAALAAFASFVYWMAWKPYIELRKIRISERESDELIELNKIRAKEESERLDYVVHDRRKQIDSEELLRLVINDKKVLDDLRNRLQINKTDLEKE